MDGAVISDIASGNSSPTYFDFDSFDEIQITTGGSDASQQGAGVQINFVTKSGGNKLRGSGATSTPTEVRSNNITDVQRDLGATRQPIRTSDYGVEVGGRSRRTKLVLGPLSNNTIHVGVVNFFDPHAHLPDRRQ